MDPFTQRMLERAKNRRDKLDCKKVELEPIISSGESYQSNSKRKSNQKMHDKENAIIERKELLSNERKSKLQKLANFYSGKETNIPFENSLSNLQDLTCNVPEKKQQCKSSRFMELTSKIKQWDEDMESQLNFFPKTQNFNEEKVGLTDETKLRDTKENFWNKALIEQLCSQGFTPSQNPTKLIYDFEKKKENEKNLSDTRQTSDNNSEILKAKPEIFKKETTKSKSEKQNEELIKSSIFNVNLKECKNRCAKDPAELSIAERKALFEGKGESSNSFFGFSKTNISRNKTDEKHKGEKIPSESWKEKEKKRDNVKAEDNCKSIVEEMPCENESNIKGNKSVFLEQKTSLAKETLDSFSKSSTDQDKPIEFQDYPLLTPSTTKTPDLSCEVVKKESKLCDSKTDRLYPNLNELDLMENNSNFQKKEILDDSQDSNFCLNLTLSDLLDLNKNNPVTPPHEESFSKSMDRDEPKDDLSETELCDYYSENENEGDMGFSSSKMMKSSSFEFTKNDGKDGSLMHTVSFYRKQQQISEFSSEINEKVNKKCVEKEKEEESEEVVLVENKIQALLAEVNKQQTIISQASQALNLCVSTIEFHGSGEQVEGERLLLLSTHKRQACLLEIQRLKLENTLWPQTGSNAFSEKGDVTLSNISLKLKRDTLRNLAAAENLSYFVCLIKSDEQVFGTSAVSATKENLKDFMLSFPEEIKLEGLRSNFKVTVEVYNLELSRELLPHDVKYHIASKKEKKLLTPIKIKKSESKLVKPNIQSPAGPNAVRSSIFQMCGYIVFSLKEVTRTQWILNKVPYVSPLEGTISMTVASQLRIENEFRGFLTMFDDISGFGAWHRRWCLLSSFFISFWKYPDDEQKKVPMGTIDLRSVISDNVDSVSRDICARRNTFLLQSTRPRLKEDRNSLVMTIEDDVTIIRHLLSADSKEEMTSWCKKINCTLALLRSWKCNFNE